MPEPTTTPPPADNKPTPAKKKEINLPPSPGSLKNTSRHAVLMNWKEQYERKLLHRCKQEGCYYPLEHVRNDIGEIKVEDGDYVMKCTWDPSHAGGEQLVTPPKKKEELGDSDL